MLQLAADEHHHFPKGAAILERNRYADDFFAGGDTLEETLMIRDDLVEILATAGMSVDKWTANHLDLLEDLSTNASTGADRHLNLDESVSTLGIRWRPVEDTFWFKVSTPTSPARHTKRTILSEVAKLFDPIGWLSPVIIRANILLQVLWLQGVDWDAPLPPVLEDEWIQFRTQLTQIESIKIPRWFGTTVHTRWQLHGFCDASERAYAAAVYIIVTTDVGTRSSLVTAKSKVAPIKVVSLPLLELCGAVLLVRLIKYLISNMETQPTHIHCWTDSRIVLAWLRSHPCKWKSYIANRTSEILSDLPQAHWRHVRSSENPVDCATRGLTPLQLSSSSLWWNGPDWLLQSKSSWPPQPVPEHPTTLEMKQPPISRLFATQATPNFTEWLQQYSSIDRIIRILAYIHRWRTNSKLPEPLRRKQWFSAAELARGRTSMLRLLQRDVFLEEIQQLQRCGEISKKGALRKLLPFLDAEDLLRVGGRLQNSSISRDEKHPVILPNKHHITKLIIRQAHQVTLHGGSSLVQGWLAQKYWIIGGRNLIRQVVRRCVICTRFNARTQEQLMGSLPAARTQPARPFSHVGVDYAGPFSIRTSGGRGQKSFKGYFAVFVCLAVKAIHLELVSDYTSQAFLAALKRFAARRGLPATVYSDNGTTFQGADTELHRLFSETAALGQEVAASVAEEGVEWSFIPPRAPHFGGIWEANVKSFKRHFTRVVGESKLTYEEFSTILCLIEACLNSRPLCSLSRDPNDLSALTLGHFLIGAPLVTPVEPFQSINEPTTICSRWHLLSLMRNHFWKRWRHEFLCQLQQRVKWLRPNRELQVGDLVVVKDELLPPTKWALGRIVTIYPGPDGLVRVVTLKTATTQLKRPVCRLIALPVSEEASPLSTCNLPGPQRRQ